MQRCPRGASLQWQRQEDTGVFGKEKHTYTHFLFSLKCSYRTCNIPNQMRSWLEKFKTAKFRLYCSRFPPGRSCWHGLCSCSHCSTAGVYHRIVGAILSKPNVWRRKPTDKRQPSNRHTESYPRIARSRKKQRKPERDWRIKCAQLLLTKKSLVQNTWHMVQMCGNAVFNIMITMNSVTMDKHAPFWEQIWPLGLSIMAAKRGKTTLCRIPIMKMRSGPPRPHSTLKTWQTKRQIWAVDFQPRVTVFVLMTVMKSALRICLWWCRPQHCKPCWMKVLMQLSIQQ